MSVEMSSSSKSGMSLNGKNISVSYMDKENADDELFLSCAAEGFAEALEEDYFDGEKAIGIYKVDEAEGIDNTSKEGMVNLLVDTGADVAFLFDVDTQDSGSFEMQLYTYDAMNQADTVQVFLGKGSFGTISKSSHGLKVGEKSAEYFTPTWQKESFVFYYFSSDKWNSAAVYANSYKFKEAMDIWLELVDSKDLYKRSCAEYNIAVACYILGERSLAKQWLDRSDNDYKLAESPSFRKKLNK